MTLDTPQMRRNAIGDRLKIGERDLAGDAVEGLSVASEIYGDSAEMSHA